uniref:Putative secreted protein n=1 Tax=Anopheles marajoara TaxID=58244 RepID=A0A2M4C777_9DIPT
MCIGVCVCVYMCLHVLDVKAYVCVRARSALPACCSVSSEFAAQNLSLDHPASCVCVRVCVCAHVSVRTIIQLDTHINVRSYTRQASVTPFTVRASSSYHYSSSSYHFSLSLSLSLLSVSLCC